MTGPEGKKRGLWSRWFRRRGDEEAPQASTARAHSEAPPEETAGEPAGEGCADAVPALMEVLDAPGPSEGPEGAAARTDRPGAAAPGEASPEPAQVEPEPGEAEKGPGGARLFGRLRQGLSRTREGFVQKVDRVLFGRREIDADTLEELEEALVTADLGVRTADRLIEEIRDKVGRKELTRADALREHLRAAVLDILKADEGHFELGPERPQVLMVVGVNGVGKTTTIGKIAAQHRAQGHKVILAAADTFRAAAIEQLEIWGERVGAQVIRHQHGADPGAVAFDAVEAAKARGADLVIVDTAGRLHTKAHLMEELKKVKRVIGKALPGAPHEVLLVLDATTGQNAINQARIFREAVGVDAIALTKLDGTAKGGVIVGICGELKIPVQYIGIGEKVDDLRPFDARAFVDALF
ncbi:MAG: signal recognition particle-docking protein FtsY [Deferrisomatales bacterium]